MNISKALLNSLKSNNLIGKKVHFSVFNKLNKNIFNVQDEEDFKSRVLDNNKPVIVDFFAVWCGPCKILAPRLEKILAKYEDKAYFAKVDIDQLTDLAMKYNINSVPTVIAMKNGKEVGKFVGLLDDDRIKKFVEDAIQK